jgi:hypothetical protein
MENGHLDDLTREVAGGSTRRRFGRLFLALGIISGTGLPLLDRDEADAKKHGHKHKHKKKCRGGTKKCGKTCIPSANCCTADDCDDGETCQSGLCRATCVPQCRVKECGDDGCGGSCGECGQFFHCDNGTCVVDCIPDCQGKACGPNGCGGSCGTCGQLFHCDNGTCKVDCIPDCQGKQCGDDGCGGTCPPGCVSPAFCLMDVCVTL